MKVVIVGSVLAAYLGTLSRALGFDPSHWQMWAMVVPPVVLYYLPMMFVAEKK